MDDNGKKKLLHEPNFLDAAFVGLCSTGLMAYSLYHHVHDRNTTAWKTSPYLFPVLIAVFGVLLAASLCADALRGARAAETADAAKQKMKMRDRVGVLVFIGISVVYYVLLPVVHFIPATILYLASLFFAFGERKWWKLALLSVAVTGAVYALFGIGLNVRLP